MLKAPRSRRQRGLSLVELMVGVAVGLFVVAGASLIVSSQLSSNRRLLLDTQIQQDLRATVDIITRELRRSGSLSNGVATDLVWAPDWQKTDGNVIASAMDVPADCGGPVVFRYFYVNNELRGFELQGGVIRSNVPNAGYQPLTDSAVLNVTAFCIAPVLEAVTRVPCPTACPDGTDACWPEVVVREYLITVEGEAANDPTIQRALTSTVRVRNDFVSDHSAGGSPDYNDTLLCPAP